MVASTLLVQMDLSGTAFGGTFVPTDVTRFVRLVDGITITSWRQDALSQISPSTLSMTLDNADLPGDATAPNGGRFTPGLSTSPWSGKILPGVRVRISETVGGTTYQLFDGFVLDWTAQYTDDGAFTTCVVNCADILAWMGTLQPLQSIQLEETQLDAPRALYQMSEPAGSTTAGNGSAISQAGILAVTASKYGGDAAVFGAAGGVVSGDTALVLNPNLSTAAGNDLKGTYLRGPAVAGVTPTADYTFEAWVSGRNRTAAQTGSIAVLAQGTKTFGLGWNIGYAAIGYRQAGGPGVGNYYGPGDVNFVDMAGSGWHHVAVTYTASTNTYRLYIDGVLNNLNVDATAPAWTPDTLYIGYDPIGGNCFRGSIQDVAIYNAPLSAARIQAHYLAGVNALTGERTDQRIARLLSYRPNLGSVLDTGSGTIGIQDTVGSTLQDALLAVGKAEGGLVYADGQGRIVLLNRVHLYDPVAAATFDAAADMQPDFTARIDLQQLVNDVTVTSPVSSQRRTDATSQASFGVRATSDTYLLNSVRDTSDAAGWLIANQKTPAVRSPQVTVDVLTETSTAQAQAALARAPLDRISLSNLPSSAPPTDVMIQGRTITIGTDHFDVAFFTSQLARKTLRADAAASANTKLDNGLVIPW